MNVARMVEKREETIKALRASVPELEKVPGLEELAKRQRKRLQLLEREVEALRGLAR